MNVIETALPGVLIVESREFRDDRGFFLETWNEARFAERGLPTRFVQDNVSFSREGVLRGMHFQHPHGQCKLVMALVGEIFDVAVDIRIGSPTFLKWTSCILSAENRRQLVIPEGFAHGFFVLSESALVQYKCTDRYDRASEGSLAWDDPEIGIEWPEGRRILSEKDAAAPRLNAFPRERLPRFSVGMKS